MGRPGDANLTSLLGQPTFDAASLTINFTVDGTVPGIQFEFVFGSDEFPEFVGDIYNDGFGAFLDGTNIAFDRLGNPITINGAFLEYDNTSPPPAPGTTQVTFPIEYDGLTVHLTSQVALAAGQHTLKLAIADGSDDRVDSAVFIAGLRFDAACTGTGVAPILTEIPSEVEVEVGDTFTLPVSADHPNAGRTVEILTIPETLPDGMTFSSTAGNPAQGLFEFTPGAMQFGQTYTITFVAITDEDVCDQATIRFRVTATIDPAITVVDVEPEAPVAGTTATLHAAVRNSGLVPASCRVCFYLDGLPGAGGELLGCAGDVGLPPESVVDASVNWNTADRVGDHQIFAVLDQVTPLSGDDPSNNTGQTSVSVVALHLSVSASDVVVTPASPVAGTTAQLRATVRNQSDASATCRVCFHRDGEPGGTGVLIGCVNDLVVAPHAASTATVAWNTTGLAGPHDLFVAIDSIQPPGSGDDPSDNLAEVPISVVPLHLSVSAPDVVVAPPAPVAGTTAQLRATVRNQSDASATCRVCFYRDGEPGGTGVLIGCVNDLVVAPHAASTATVAWNTTGLAGPHDLVAAIDSIEPIGSGDDPSDNLAEVPVDVLPAPDLIVDAVTVPSQGLTSQPFEVVWRVRNISKDGTASGAWQDRVYRSTSDVFDENAVQIGSIGVNIAGFGPDATYTRSGVFTLPAQAGLYWIFVQTDGNNTVVEDLGEDNNSRRSDHPIEVVRLPVPDLTVTNVTPPDDGVLSGGTTQVLFTVRNQGDGATPSTWKDCIFLSVDTDLVDPPTWLWNEQFMSTYGNPFFLLPGEGYTQAVNLRLPEDRADTYFLGVYTDCGDGRGPDGSVFGVPETDETNNLLFSTAFRVDLAPQPDLQVSGIQATPNPVFSAQFLTVTWTDTNAGNGITDSGSWTDAVYLSSNPQPVISPGDEFLTQVGRGGLPLAPGASDTSRSAAVLLRQDLEGLFFVKVAADVGNVITEFGFEDNNVGVSAQAVEVILTLPADLVPTEVSGSTDGIPGHTLNVSWSVDNIGAPPPLSISWVDAMYLSTDDVFQPGTDLLLGTFGASAVANKFLPYTRTRTFRLPNALAAGGYRYIVVVDANGQVPETANGETNNVRVSSETLHVELRPTDLQIAMGFDADLPPPPPSAAAGQSIPLSWRVTNAGVAVTPVSFWTDGVFLSNDTDRGPGDINVTSFTRNGELFPGGSYVVDRIGVLPLVAPGNYFLLFATDVSNQVYEQSPGEGNNVVASPFTVTPDASDLTVTGFDVPTSAAAGQSIPLSWRVTNAGVAVTPVSFWTDGVFLSNDTDWGPGDINVTSFTRNGELSPGGIYVVDRSGVVPLVAPGNYFLLFVTDVSNQVYEQITGEENNVVASPFTVTPDASDLTVTGFDVPATGRSGETVRIGWTVTNAGTLPTNSTFWLDEVRLSPDPVVGGDDVVFPQVARNAGLAPGESYSVARDFMIPLNRSGTFYVIKRTDAGNHVFESNEANNVFLKPIVIDVELADLANLVVDSLNVPSSALSGQPIEINWSVRNAGLGATNSANWADFVYLSRDQFIDPGTDILLGSFQRNGSLAPSESYNALRSFVVPLGASGPYFVIVVTDANNQVFEHTNEGDNGRVSSTLVDVVLPLPSDLVVDSVDPPVSGVLGELATFHWNIRNAGGQPVNGSWSDLVFLSTDQVLDSADRQVGAFVRPSGALNPDDVTPVVGTARIPGVLPGDYYAIVRTDVFNQIGETNETNNERSSSVTFSVSAIPLTLGEKHVGTLATGEERYFRLETPPGETVRITLDHAGPTAWTELYAKFGSVPSPGDFDFIFDAPALPDQKITIPATFDGVYYLLARTTAGAGGGSPTDFSLLAQTIPFGIEGLSPQVVGLGRVTLRLTGSRWDGGTTFKLRHTSTSDEVLPTLVDLISSTTADVRFELGGARTGSYDVVASSGGSTAELPGGLFVERGTLLSGSASVEVGPAIRKGTGGRYVLLARNTGNVDIEFAIARFLVWDIHGFEVTLPEFDDTSLGAGNGTRFIEVLIENLAVGRTTSVDLDVTVALTYPFNEMGATGEVEVFTREQYREQVWIPEAEKLRLRILDDPTIDLATKALFEDDQAYLDAMRLAFQNQYSVTSTVAEAGIGRKILCGTVCGAVGAGAGAAVCGPVCVSPAAPLCIACLGAVAGGAGVACYECCVDPCQCCFGCCDPPPPPPPPPACPGPTGTCVASSAIAANGSCSGDRCGETPGSRDPNEKAGPAGFGEERFIGAGAPVTYRIDFENVPEATAPAALVRITDPIDPSLNLGSFRVGDVHFGDVDIDVPENRFSFQTTVDLTASHGVLVDVTAGVNASTSEAFWNFQAIDPLTGFPPTAGNLGFLPPNDDTGRGQGWVYYTIRPRGGVASGTVVRNRAEIVFDLNGVIETNEVSNTLDGETPSSAVSPLPPISPSPNVNLEWSGSDPEGGAGLAGFTVLVSTDGAPYSPFISDTLDQSATFVGEYGHRYAFYSVATDNAGNVEAPPTQADAETTIPPSLQVSVITVNGELSQRSNLTDVSVAFGTDTNLGTLIGDGTVLQAVALWKRGSGGDTPVQLGVDHYLWSPGTRTLSIDLTTDGPGGSEATLLADGNYELRMEATAILSSFGLPLLDGDGIVDGVYRFGDDAGDAFFRLSGDGNGDRTVNFLDQQLVRSSWLLSVGQPGFDPNADVNSDGVVNFLDQQLVRSNWLTVLPF